MEELKQDFNDYCFSYVYRMLEGKQGLCLGLYVLYRWKSPRLPDCLRAVPSARAPSVPASTELLVW